MVENSLSNVKSSVKRKPGPRSFKPFKLSPEDISAFLKSAINKIEDYFYLVDMNGRVLYANDSACRGLGYSLEEIITMKVSNFDPNYPKIVWGKFIEEVRSSGSFKVQSLHINKSGVAFPVSITGVYLKYKNAEYMFAFVNDITEINRIKESLTEAVRMYNLLAANMSDSVLILDTKLQPVYMSPSAINERGYTLEEYKNLPLQEKYSADSMKRVWDVWSHMKSMSPSSSASQLMRQNLEVECYRKDGTSYWSDNQVTLLRDESGDVTGLLVVGRNITEKKLNEQRIFDLNQALNRRVFELEASNKELEAFAYSVSHDMTAPLRSINGFSQAYLKIMIMS
ncbi:MAG: PAS domain S-box protein [Dehalococcoidia bacterium]|nr:MAG: PAS domain S-box protein [Dehalococcoidia bacterium]